MKGSKNKAANISHLLTIRKCLQPYLYMKYRQAEVWGKRLIWRELKCEAKSKNHSIVNIRDARLGICPVISERVA